jgi:DNA-binding Lrp family transcriptional regulator
MFSNFDLELIDYLHGGFPLDDRPYETVGRHFGVSEKTIIDTLNRLLNEGYLTRFGPLFQIEKAGGQFVLAAIRVPEERFDEVAEFINSLPEVAHNYRREHHLNMWFVVATESQVAAQQTIDAIEAQTQLKVYAFPKEKEFFVELRLPLTTSAVKELS